MNRINAPFATVATLVCAISIPAAAQNCANTSTGFVPINDLGAGMYLGAFPGGLYPNGRNAPPASHRDAGLAAARAIQPLGPSGVPDPGGSYALLSIGMSNTTQEFCSRSGREPCDPWTLMGQAAVDPIVNTSRLVIVNGARGGQAAGAWESPASTEYERIRTDVLARKGLSELQVRAAWVKVANPGPTISLPNTGADAFRLLGQIGNIARALKTRYPNMEQVLLSSRIYAGYATTALNPEPYAYESAFAVKWVIEAQIRQRQTGQIDPIAGDLSPPAAPWLGWAAYLWADGLTPRSDSLIWECPDFRTDGTHPSQSGQEKVATMLLDLFKSSPFTELWFVEHPLACYADCDTSTGVGTLDIFDFLCFQTSFVNSDPYACDCDSSTGPGMCDILDFLCFQSAFVSGCP